MLEINRELLLQRRREICHEHHRLTLEAERLVGALVALDQMLCPPAVNEVEAGESEPQAPSPPAVRKAPKGGFVRQSISDQLVDDVLDAVTTLGDPFTDQVRERCRIGSGTALHILRGLEERHLVERVAVGVSGGRLRWRRIAIPRLKPESMQQLWLNHVAA